MAGLWPSRALAPPLCVKESLFCPTCGGRRLGLRMSTTRVAVAHACAKDSAEAGRELAAGILQALGGGRVDCLVVFVSPHFHYETLLTALNAACRPASLVGCSSAGEFSQKVHDRGSAVAFAIRSDILRFSVGLGRAVNADFRNAAREAAQGFKGIDSLVPGKAALVLLDALAGRSEDIVSELTTLTRGGHQFFGGGAGDDGQFQKTQVFVGTKAYEDAVVLLEILADKPIGVGSANGWQPDTAPMRVTAAQGSLIESLNSFPALDVYEEYAKSCGAPFDRNEPLPFFLEHIIGVEAGAQHRLRVPLSGTPDGAIRCAADVPVHSLVRLMKATTDSAREAAAAATRIALKDMQGAVSGALFFDCVATRLRLGGDFNKELQAVQDLLPQIPLAGCNTYGQVVRATSQFNGFHNCTAVICLLPD